MSILEKTALKSKKFIAFFFTLLLLAGILIFALVTQTIGWPLTAFMCIGIFGISFLAVSYIGKQGDLDKFVRGVSQLKGTSQDDSSTEDSLE